MKSFNRFLRIICLTVSILIFTSIQGQNPVDKILEIFEIINIAYVDSFDSEALTESAIVSMLAELDPHSVYIPKEEVQKMSESLKGNYEGIGIQFEIYRDTIDTSIGDHIQLSPAEPFLVGEKSILWFEADTSANNTSVRGRFSGKLFRDADG